VLEVPIHPDPSTEGDQTADHDPVVVARKWPWKKPLVVLLVVLAVAELTVALAEWRAAHHTVAAASSRPALPPPAPNTALGRAVDPSSIIADPDVMTGRGVDYLYSSASNYTAPYLPVRTFRTLGKWEKVADAMPVLPVWAAPWIWNPSVRYVEGRYVMWFSASLKGTYLPTTRGLVRCLGWATSKSPLGPFVASPKPSICQVSLFGAIDPQTLIAPNGQAWLYWKSTGNAVPNAHAPTYIWAQRLAPNGVTREGSKTMILTDSQPWEGTVVESPQMVYEGGHYYLFFSGNVSGSTLNGIGLARCTGPAGPCANTSNGPWLGTSPETRTAGEESLFSQYGSTWILYAPHGLGQTLMVSRVAFGPKGPYVAAFTHLPSVR